MSAPAAKHFLNSPASLVLDSLQGLCAVNPQVTLDSQNKSKQSDLPFNRSIKSISQLCMSPAMTRARSPLFVAAARDMNLLMRVL